MKLLARDLAALRLPPVHALAVACHDVLNHLPSEAALRRVLRSVRRALAPGGAFVFDALTDHAFETLWADNTHRLEGPHGDLWMDCDYDPRAAPRHRPHDGLRAAARAAATRGTRRRSTSGRTTSAGSNGPFAARASPRSGAGRGARGATAEFGSNARSGAGARPGDGPVTARRLRALGFRRVS